MISRWEEKKQRELSRRSVVGFPLVSLLSHFLCSCVAYYLGILMTSGVSQNVLALEKQFEEHIISNNKAEKVINSCNCVCEDNGTFLGKERDGDSEPRKLRESNLKAKTGSKLLMQQGTSVPSINKEASHSTQSLTETSASIRSYIAGAARVSRDDFIAEYDLGVPWDATADGAKDVLLLYSSEQASPRDFCHRTDGSEWPKMYYASAKDSTENCDKLKVVLTEPFKLNECLAIVPQYQSHHVYNLMRWKDDKYLDDKTIPEISKNYSLKHVSRIHTSYGYTRPLPKPAHTRKYLPMLTDYLLKLDKTTEMLKPVLSEIAGRNSKYKNVIVVMVCNFGQSELFLNFVCSAKSRGLDLSNVLLFATDKEMYKLAKSISEVTVFDVDNAFGDNLPKTAATAFGDTTFRDMMLSKVYCVHLVNHLGYDVLFQDVDVTWYKNPLEYFENIAEHGYFDIYFQDDGSRSNDFQTYSANTGFYFVRNNDRTRYLLSVYMRSGDSVMANFVDQTTMNDLLSDHASSTGLRVKVLDRDSREGMYFPGGFHYHRRWQFMKDVILGKENPYIFHMSWTQSKDNKKRFVEQMGNWFLLDRCFKNVTTFIDGDETDFVGNCCSTEPLFVCHYRDKPSIKPCNNSTSLNKDGEAFW